jgi:hypothetical protein
VGTIADLLDGDRFASVQHVTAGWSDDHKYRVTTHAGSSYLCCGRRPWTARTSATRGRRSTASSGRPP